MHLDHLEARSQSAADRILECQDHAADPRFVELDRRGVAFVERDRARAHHGPAAGLGCLQPSPAQPGRLAARLSARVGQLNAGDRPLGMDEPGNTRQRLDVLLAPDAHVLGRNPPLGRHGGCLHHDEPDTTRGATAKVHEVPVVRKPFVGAILTHRRHHDPIAKGDTPNRQRAQEVDVGHLAVVVRLGRTPVDGDRIPKSLVCGVWWCFSLARHDRSLPSRCRHESKSRKPVDYCCRSTKRSATLQ